MDGITGGQEGQDIRSDSYILDHRVEGLFPSLSSGICLGLKRTRDALKILANPHHSYRTIHVGGTNGKGSVASTLAAVLEMAGFRTGCYTSPHLCSFRERIRVSGKFLTPKRLLSLAEDMADIPGRCGLTFFEAATILGLYAFEQEGVEIAVVEVGLGGRLDATNVITPEVTGITNIAMDHSDYLGSSLQEIAREKLGIVKPHVPLITTESDPALLEIFREVTSQNKAPLVRAKTPAANHVSIHADGTSFHLETDKWGALQIETPLIGRHQVLNTCLAIEMLAQMPVELRPQSDVLRAAVAGVKHFGRNQIEVIDGRTWLFDVAHNPAGTDSLIDTIDSLDLPRPLVALVGVLGDKDWKTMISSLMSRVDQAVLTQPPSVPFERCWNPENVEKNLGVTEHLRVEKDFEQAVLQARTDAGNGTVVVTGSVHTVGSALQILNKEPLRGV